ncbi:phosphatidate cytidylyltransferase [Rhodoligotrophos ferricapiens]|uniref:phosphatidate cytidylyltransferase n=1 Tax=Rhodoligotrophos ferricapiens TaxID=3069264 RepID=UPI00315D90D8
MGATNTSGKWGDFAIRTGSAVLLVPVVIALAWLGGAWFALLLAVFGVLMALEWVRLVNGKPDLIQQGLHGAAAAAVPWLVLAKLPGTAFAFIALAWVASLLWLLSRRHGQARAALIGLPYIALPVLSLALLRADATHGLSALLWLMIVVWSADTGAYLVGRLVGGPKLAPQISPGKTWSGLVGAVTGAALAGGLLGRVMDLPAIPPLVALAGLLAVIAQLGDLFESHLKRQAGVKDSGKLIPGHGGILDRVDGLIAVALGVLAIGVLRSGTNNIAAALLLW